jgi:hypothetical protein
MKLPPILNLGVMCLRAWAINCGDLALSPDPYIRSCHKNLPYECVMNDHNWDRTLNFNLGRSHVHHLRLPPTAAGQLLQQKCDQEEHRDYLLFEGAVVVIGIESKYPFNPVVPENGKDTQKQGDESKD